MSVTYIKKDITEVTEGIVVHGCNCQGAMGSGVAHAIRQKWPIVYRRYKDFIASSHWGEHGIELLGTAQIVEISANNPTLLVINLFTQQFYGRDGAKYANPDAIYLAVDTAMQIAEWERLLLYMPRIGCGLGGLDWDTEVYPIVQQLADKHKVNTFVCDLH